MRVAKICEHNQKTRLVSKIFDRLIVRENVPFDRIELHVRDKNTTSVDNGKAVLCVDYNDPFVLEGDEKGIRIMLAHEIFRLKFKFDLPQDIEDVIIGREMLKRGFGDDLCYLYYNRLIRSKSPETVNDYIRANLPWIIFSKHDKYNSDLLKGLAEKICRKKFKCKRLFDILLDISHKNLSQAVEEYRCATCKS